MIRRWARRMDTANKCLCLPCVCRPDARLLVLGSMPGRASLEAQQYYAHPRNAFWPILYSHFGVPLETAYEERLRFAIAHGVALWDSAAACERAGSLDADMKKITINDFTALFAVCPQIRAVACNGARAHALFMKSPWSARVRVYALPSTSPANAGMCFEEKAACWARALAETEV